MATCQFKVIHRDECQFPIMRKRMIDFIFGIVSHHTPCHSWLSSDNLVYIVINNDIKPRSQANQRIGTIVMDTHFETLVSSWPHLFTIFTMEHNYHSFYIIYVISKVDIILSIDHQKTWDIFAKSFFLFIFWMTLTGYHHIPEMKFLSKNNIYRYPPPWCAFVKVGLLMILSILITCVMTF